MEKRCFLEAIATLMGCVIGAGILGIPYVVAKSGILIGIINILVIGMAVILMNLYFGEVVLRTKGNHQLTGYAEKYLGKPGKRIMLVTITLGIYGALIAYLQGAGESIGAITGISPLAASLGFFALMAGLIALGLKAIERSEFYMTGTKLIIFLVICLSVFASQKWQGGNLGQVNIGQAFLPMGVILFAFLGLPSIPEMKEELCHNRKLLKRAILTGSALVLVVYVLFAISIVGVTGHATTEVGTIGLGQVLGERMVVIGNLFAILAMATSFLALGLALREVFQYDYRFSAVQSLLLTCFVPFVIFLLGFHDFIRIIAISGALTGGIEGILVVLMHRASQSRGDRKPEYAIRGSFLAYSLLFLLFIGGIIYQMVLAF